jgi:hypothetical protein
MDSAPMLELDDFDYADDAKRFDSETSSFSDYCVGSGPATRALVEAGLHHPVELVPMAWSDGEPDLSVRRWRGVRCSKTKKMFGRPVTASYHLAQNMSIAAMLDAFLDDDAKVEVQAFGGGERIVFRCPMSNGVSDEQRVEIIEQRRKYNWDVHKWPHLPEFVLPAEHALVITNGHGATEKIRAREECRFLACDNGLYLDIGKHGFTFPHRACLDERMKQMAKAFELAKAGAGNMAELCQRLFQTPMNATQFTEFIETMFPETAAIRESARAQANLERKRERFEEVYQHAPGAAPGNLFGALQAATYHYTHEHSVRPRHNLNDPVEIRMVKKAKRHELQLFGKSFQETQKALNWCRVQLH